MNVGADIRRIRVAKGLSQGFIEGLTGLRRCYLSRVENGHTTPTIVTVQKIADALSVPMSEIFAPSDLAPPSPAASMSIEELNFLNLLRQYSAELSNADKRLLIEMVRKFGAAPSAPEVNPERLDAVTSRPGSSRN